MKQKIQSSKAENPEMPYECQIDITFPSAKQALYAKEVLQVDGEIGDQICKSFDVTDYRNKNGDMVTGVGSNVEEGGEDDFTCVLRL